MQDQTPCQPVAMLTERSICVFIVDPQPSDYANFCSAERAAALAFQCLRRGDDALRAAERTPPDLWIINVRLEDMSGFNLVETIKAQRWHSDVFVVADEYCREDEVRALSMGIAMYGCKPLSDAWLRDWRGMPRLAARETIDSQETQQISNPKPQTPNPRFQSVVSCRLSVVGVWIETSNSKSQIPTARPQPLVPSPSKPP